MILANHFINNSQLNAQKMKANYGNSHVLLLLFILVIIIIVIIITCIIIIIIIINTLFEIEKNLHSSV